MDLKQEFAPFFQSDGVFALAVPYLLRRGTGLKCRCLDPVTGDARPNCPTCGGTGEQFVLVPVKAVKQLGSTPEAYPFARQQTDVGKISVPAYRFYLPAGTKVSFGDELWEVAWDQSGRPVDLICVYRITVPDPLMVGRENVLVRVYGHVMSYTFRIARFILRQVNGQNAYEPLFSGEAAL